MKDYEIIKTGCPEELGALVAKRLRRGWQLHGSPFTVTDKDEERRKYTLICQAMVNERIQNYVLNWQAGEKCMVTSDGWYRIERIPNRHYGLFIGQSETPIEDEMSLQEAYDRAEIIWAEDIV